MPIQTGDNKFGVAKWIVDPVAGLGTHTTITSAITSASSGDDVFIRPGTYTENPTIKAGVNVTAFEGDDLTPTVTVIGKFTMTTAGSATISGIRLQTNSDFLLAVTGSAASVVYLENCYLNITNNTAISYTSSSSSSSIRLSNCQGDITTTGITTIVATGAGIVSFLNCFIGNGGASTTPSSTSACQMSFFNGLIGFPCSTSSTGAITSDHCSFNTGNATCITTAGTGGAICQFTELQSGTASALSIGVGTTITATQCTVNSSNANAITGAGTLSYTPFSFINTGTSSNVTTQNPAYIGPTIRNNQQPAFFAYVTNDVPNTTGTGTNYTIIYNGELFDQNSNFNTATGTFTAPVTGRYQFNLAVAFSNLSGGMNNATAEMFDSTGRHYRFADTAISSANGDGVETGSFLVPMTAGDTMQVLFSITGGAGDTVTVTGLTAGYYLNSFSGYLAC